jgi:phytoene dehydrogenase-like protein
MKSPVNYVVIGAGINGLTVACELAMAGHSVTLIESTNRLGGFIDSGERTLPGYVHDTYSSWHPLFVSGGAYAALGPSLHRHGLEYLNTDDAVTASVSGDDRVAIAYRDVQKTASALELAQDQDAYLAMLADLGRNADLAFGALGTELRSPRSLSLALKMLRRNKIAGSEHFARESLMSGRAFLRNKFDGWDVDQLWSPWLLHAGLGPDHTTGGVMLPIMAMSMHNFGLPIVAGGAAHFVSAFSRILEENGVEIKLGNPVDSIILDKGRAVGVRVAGETVMATRGVIASVTPGALYENLLPEASVSPQVKHEVSRYRPGRGAMQIHVALDRPVQWSDSRLNNVPLIHVTDGTGSTGIACAQAEAGLLPADPTIVVGQQYVLDPSRVPDGAGSLWLQLQEVPFAPRGDAGGELDVSSGWTETLKQQYCDRVLRSLERHAPGLTSSILATEIISPLDLLSANSNATDGDPYGGSAELHQNLLWRPTPSTSRHKSAIPGLWHIGASTHPGPGLGGGSGHLAAQLLLRGRAPRR